MVQETEVKTDFMFTNRVIGNTAFMLLNLGIGPDKDEPDAKYIDGSQFSDEMYYWKGQGKQITVKINTPGGRVDHGWSMIDAIQECGANTFGAGLAYSMGGICLMFGKHRSAYDYASIMIHAPRGGNKAVLDVVKNQFRTLLENRTKFTKAEIDDMMDSGKDYFFTAEQAKAKGIIDEVIPSGKSLLLPANASAKDLCVFYNNHTEDFNQKTDDMDFKQIIAKLTGKTDEAEGIVAVTEMKSQIDAFKAKESTWTTEKAALEAKVKTLEDAGKVSDIKAQAKELITGAEKAGKLKFKDDAARTKAVEDATANFDFTKSLIESMPATKTDAAAAQIKLGDKAEQNTYEWLAKNDPKKLNAIAESDPELFNKLSDEYIAKKKEATQ